MALLDKLNESYLDARLFANIVLAKKRNRRTPLFVYIMITNRCNLKCVYCCTQCNQLAEKDFPLPALYQSIDELSQLGTRYISIQGGEPLLRNDLEDILDYINAKGIISEVITNALFVRKRLSAIRKAKRLCISIDGYDGYNDSNRGKGTFRQIMRNIDYARQNGVKIYRIESTFTKNNNTMGNLRFLAELSKELKCIFTPFAALITGYNASEEFRSIALQDREDLTEFWHRVGQLKNEGYNIHFNEAIINNVDYMPKTVHERYDAKTTKRLGLPFCTFGRLSCYIDTDGQMYPCVPLFGLKGCNIFERGVRQCWESFDDLDCTYCFVGGFCSFADINPKSIKHIVQTYMKHIAK